MINDNTGNHCIRRLRGKSAADILFAESFFLRRHGENSAICADPNYDNELIKIMNDVGNKALALYLVILVKPCE
jgi:hypothetical protein